MTHLLLRTRDLRYTINHRPILNGIDFELHTGELVGLIGANGAGKTTLLKVMSGLWSGATGQIDLLGRPLRAYQPRDIARMVAHVPQATRVDFAFTAREVVLMGRSPHLSRFELESVRDREIADAAMHTTDTAYLADRMVNTLSGGEQQRVMVARALAQEPRVLMLDEPTSNLDIKHQVGVLNLVRTLAHERELGIVAAIHDLGLAARFCDRLVMLADGTISADGQPEDVLTPERVAEVFDVEAQVYRDPYSGHLTLSVKD